MGNKRGGFGQVIQKYGVPIVSAFCMTDVLDPSKRKTELEKLDTLDKIAEGQWRKTNRVLSHLLSNGKDFDYKEHERTLLNQ